MPYLDVLHNLSEIEEELSAKVVDMFDWLFDNIDSPLYYHRHDIYMERKLELGERRQQLARVFADAWNEVLSWEDAADRELAFEALMVYAEPPF